MTLLKLMIVSVIVFAANVKTNDEDFRRIDRIYQEPPCSSEGICTIAEDCPHGQLARPGLCPKQRSQGVECCYGLSTKETRCGRRGGVCLPSTSMCSPKLTYFSATDCPKNTKCCIMV